MKHVLVVLFTFFGAASFGLAQELPCLDALCPEWQYPFQTSQAILNININGDCGPDCVAIITFKHRLECGEVCDVYIEKVVFSNPTKCFCGTSLDGMRAAIAALLVSDHPSLENCLPEGEGCVPVVRVTIGGCYRLLYRDEYHEWGGYEACGAQICCLGEYEICRDANGDLSFTQTIANEPVLSCQILEGIPDPNICYQFCEALPQNHQPSQTKYSHNAPRSPFYTLTSDDIELYPNPATGFVTIRCSAENIESGVLEIVSATGEIIQRIHLTSDSNGKLGTQLELNDFPSGVYGFRVISKGSNQCSGTFTVTR